MGLNGPSCQKVEFMPGQAYLVMGRPGHKKQACFSDLVSSTAVDILVQQVEK